MADYLIQRHIPNAPNSDSGAWVDEGIARDLKADQAQEALDATATPHDGTRRVVRWDTVEEYTPIPQPPTFTKTTKEAIDEPKPAKGVGGNPQTP